MNEVRPSFVHFSRRPTGQAALQLGMLQLTAQIAVNLFELQMPFVTTDVYNSPVPCALTTLKNLEDDECCTAKNCFLDEAVSLLFGMLTYVTYQQEEQQSAISVVAFLICHKHFD